MKAMIVEAAGSINMKGVELRAVKDNEVLVKVAWAGICATDIAIYTGECSFVKSGDIHYPCRIGHEWAGIVADVGKDVTRFHKGDRIITDNVVSCGLCEHCRQGNYGKCEHTMSVGTIRCWDGCFAEYMYMPEFHVYPLPDNLSLKDAALAEPVSIALGAVEKYPIQSETKVLVLGTGSIALSVAALARKMGAGKVIVVGRNVSKLSIALKCGATDIVSCKDRDPLPDIMQLTGGTGADFVIEASGAAEHIMTSILAAKQRGSIAWVAFYERDIEKFAVDYLISKELRVTGIMGEVGLPAKAARYIAEGLSLQPIVTKQILFEDAPQYFKEAREKHRDDIKVIVKMSGAE